MIVFAALQLTLLPVAVLVPSAPLADEWLSGERLNFKFACHHATALRNVACNISMADLPLDVAIQVNTIIVMFAITQRQQKSIGSISLLLMT